MELVSDLSTANLVGNFCKFGNAFILTPEPRQPLYAYRGITSFASRTFSLLGVETAVE